MGHTPSLIPQNKIERNEEKKNGPPLNKGDIQYTCVNNNFFHI